MSIYGYVTKYIPHQFTMTRAHTVIGFAMVFFIATAPMSDMPFANALTTDIAPVQSPTTISTTGNVVNSTDSTNVTTTSGTTSATNPTPVSLPNSTIFVN